MTSINIDALQAVLAGMCSISYLYFGAYILSPSLKDKSIRPLLYLCVFSFFWSLSYILYYLSIDKSIRDLWQRFTFAGMLAFAFLLWFIIRYTGLIRDKKIETLISIVLWLPPLASVFMSISENAVAEDFPCGFWFLYAEIQGTIYNVSSILLFLLYYKRKKTNKTKILALIFTTSAFIIITLSWVADYYLGFQNSQNQMPFWLLLWMGIFLYTIKRYRFIRISPEFIADDISENIEEGIVLLDPDLKSIFANSAFRRLVNAGNEEEIVLQEFINEKQYFNDELLKMKNNGGTNFRMQFNLIPGNGGAKLPVDIKIKKVIDKYKDTSGYLVLVSSVRNIAYLQARYRISNREIEVIRHLALGVSNKNIARLLGIKEPTVETHVKNIYNKIGINNRTELLYILFEFGIFTPPKS